MCHRFEEIVVDNNLVCLVSCYFVDKMKPYCNTMELEHVDMHFQDQKKMHFSHFVLGMVCLFYLSFFWFYPHVINI